MLAIAQTAEKEYEKNPDIKKKDIDLLKDWLNKQPHLPEMSEVELILFYHSCESSMELTKTTIDIFYTLRTHMDMYFTDRDPTTSKNMYTFDKILFAPLPQTTAEGYKVVYCRLLDYDPSHFFYENAAKNFSIVSDICQYEEGSYPGFVIVVDMDKVVMGHIGRLSIMAIRHTLHYLQEAMPVRLKGFHFLNAPVFMDKLLMMMKPFIKKRFLDMLHIHSGPIDSVFKHIPKEAFPKELGGNHDPFLKIRDDLIAKLTANRQFFIDEEKRRIDESKRPGKPKNIGEIFGVEGSFKKLDLD